MSENIVQKRKQGQDKKLAGASNLKSDHSSAEVKKKKSIRLILIVVIGFSMLSLFLIATVATILSARGHYCASIDITECSLDVRIHNDTNTTYIIKPCVGEGEKICHSYGTATIIKPATIHTFQGTTTKEVQPYLVTDDQGKAAGCLNLEYMKEYTNQSVDVSLSKLISCNPYL